MVPKPEAKPVAGVNKPIASLKDMELARKGGKLLVKAEGENRPRAVPDHLAKVLCGHWKALLEEKGHIGVPITLMHKPKAVQFVVDWISAGGMDATGEGSVPYPHGNVDSLRKLSFIAECLQIPSLFKRAEADIKAVEAQKEVKEAARAAQQGAESPKSTTASYCDKCWSPAHFSQHCPCPFNNGTNTAGYWTYTPANLKPNPFGPKLGQKQPMEKPEDIESRVDNEGEAAPEPVPETEIRVTGLSKGIMRINRADFIVHDQDGFRWFVPRRAIKLKVVGITEGGQLQFSGQAPFEYSWSPNEDLVSHATPSEAAKKKGRAPKER